MNKMELYKLSEDIKNSWSTIFEHNPEWRVSDTAVDASAPLMAKCLNEFERLVEEEDQKRGIIYLMNTLSYYILIGQEMKLVNEKMAEYIKELEER
jgi:hypothetical protein